VRTINFLTDDPWNPAHRAPWFLETLPFYDCVFSPRQANLDDLRRLGCRHVSYVSFAYAPGIHFPEGPGPEGGADGADLFFAGGADRDRVPYLAACIRAGFRVRLHGGYWHRYRETRAHAGGHLGPAELRRALRRAKVALCLVRRANRDGHVMRSFEIPAVGTCMLTEDTEEHRQIFGPDGQHVVYFRSLDEMVGRLRWLLDRPEERARLAAAAHRLIAVDGKNTYRDRLETMLALAAEHS
jgi:spore maturation protein CgeB